MTLGELTKDASPYLVSWINLTTAPNVSTTLHDLKKIKRLEEKNFPGPCGGYGARALAPVCKRVLSQSGKRNWALLGALSGLQTLAFPKGTPPGIIGDFSFLPRLKNLQRLKLQYTDFSDCSLLAGLTQLKYLTLPARKKLIHTEVLNALTCEICTDDPFPAGSRTPPYRILPVREAPPSLPPGFAVRLLEYGETAYTNGEITQQVVDEIAELIRAGEIHSLLLSPNETGDWDLFTMDIAGGWAAPVLHFTWDPTQRPILCQPINGKYAGSDEAAPVQIDGQTPVSKNFSLEDLDLAAKCAVYFAKTGKLYPAIPWAEFS